MTKITSYTINKNDREYIVNVSFSKHAEERYSQRNIKCNQYGIAGNIMALGTAILCRVNHDLAIIDAVNDFTLIVNISRQSNTNTLDANIITVIDKSDVFVKRDTDIINVSELF